MNDPCGLVYLDGEWHLFYQYNPTIAVWGTIHWGHAVSKDLVRWQHLAPALKPHETLGMVFTGSAVRDRHNTSGLCPGGCLVAMFTHALGKDKKEQQSIAHSTDRGRTWTEFSGNPVIPNPGVKDFRDPRVIWHPESQRWVMLLASGDRAPMYTSKDLKRWTQVSTFGPIKGLPPGAVWECPELFQMKGHGKTRWVLKVDLNVGMGKPGSHGRYWVGTFDGQTFTPTGEAAGTRLDWGEDFYAAQLFTDAPGGQRIWIGWMGSWQYSLQSPAAGWRGAMSVPRRLAMRGERLIQVPVDELKALRGGCPPVVDLSGDKVTGESKLLDGVRGGSLELQATLKLSGGAGVGLRLLRDGKGNETVVGYDAGKGELYLDRRRSGEVSFHPGFAARHGAPLKLTDGKLDLRIYIDRSTVEVFTDGGAVVISDTVYPNGGKGLGLFAVGGEVLVASLKIWRLGNKK